MCPSAYAPVRTVSPKASDTPTRPIPSGLPSPPKFAARTALPQPPSTSQNVPISSAISLLSMVASSVSSGWLGRGERPTAVEDLGARPIEADHVVPAGGDRQAVHAAGRASTEADGD